MKSKKELKEEYKQMKFPMGVFQIRNISGNKVFIDNSVDMPSKWNRHRVQLKFGTHRNIGLQKDWNNLGEANFVFEILSELDHNAESNLNHQKELQLLQKMIIEDLNLHEDMMY